MKKKTNRKSASKKQLKANRNNSKSSTGPRTAEGKEKSKWNALKHGMSAETVVLPAHCSDERVEEYLQLVAELKEDLDPIGFMQESSAKRIADLLWRLGRAKRVEVGTITRSLMMLDKQEMEELASTTSDYSSFQIPQSHGYQCSIGGTRMIIALLKRTQSQVFQTGETKTETQQWLDQMFGSDEKAISTLTKRLTKIAENVREKQKEDPEKYKDLKFDEALKNRILEQIKSMLEKLEYRVRHLTDEKKKEFAADRAILYVPTDDRSIKVQRYETRLEFQLEKELKLFFQFQKRRRRKSS